MTPWLLPPLSFLAMAVQDVLGTLLVQAEASYRAHRAGMLDMVQDAANKAGTIIVTGSVLLSHDHLLQAAVIVCTLAADYTATYAGVRFGHWLDHKQGCPKDCPRLLAGHGLGLT